MFALVLLVVVVEETVAFDASLEEDHVLVPARLRKAGSRPRGNPMYYYNKHAHRAIEYRKRSDDLLASGDINDVQEARARLLKNWFLKDFDE